MGSRRGAVAGAAASALLVGIVLTGCVPEPGAGPSPDASPTASGTASGVASPSPTASSAPVIPADCREMLTVGVQEQLAGIPLNSPDAGVSGPQADGSLVCVWGDPTTAPAKLTTTLTYMSRGPALEMLNGLLSEGFACYTPDGGTRCEKTWFTEPGLNPAGRTLFWRDDILVDTEFVSLAPSGYTAAIVSDLFG